MSNNGYKSEEIVKLIRNKYPSSTDGSGAWVVLEQVPDGTGSYQNRWIDVAVFSLWPSKGLYRMAFEIKVDRGDFLRELANPEKHNWCFESFHQFWFIAPKGVIQKEELPDRAGWMYPRGNQLCIGRNAVANPQPKLDDRLLGEIFAAFAKLVTVWPWSCRLSASHLPNSVNRECSRLIAHASLDIALFIGRYFRLLFYFTEL